MFIIPTTIREDKKSHDASIWKALENSHNHSKDSDLELIAQKNEFSEGEIENLKLVGQEMSESIRKFCWKVEYRFPGFISFRANTRLYNMEIIHSSSGMPPKIKEVFDFYIDQIQQHIFDKYNTTKDQFKNFEANPYISFRSNNQLSKEMNIKITDFANHINLLVKEADLKY